ncbi:MAG: SEL1-like repeat protein, partial [Anaerolineales bacterium]
MAQYNLGLMYSKGRGVPQDYVKAHMWLNLAAAQGFE